MMNQINFEGLIHTLNKKIKVGGFYRPKLNIEIHQNLFDERGFCLGGCYIGNKNTIQIALSIIGRCEASLSLVHTFLHEVGHWFHIAVLGRSWDSTGDEFFAETFANIFFHNLDKAMSLSIERIHQVWGSYGSKKMNRGEIIPHLESVLSHPIYNIILNWLYEQPI